MPSSSAPEFGTTVGTLLWMALLDAPLTPIATEIAALRAPPPDATSGGVSALSADAERIKMYLGALAGRLMHPSGWVAGERRAGAEPIWTGRASPYDESTLRKQVRSLAQQGATDVVARAVEQYVEQAVEASGTRATAYTDIFDQVYWTKQPAYAAPIGNRGNRLLAATYFSLTFVQPEGGPVLGYHCAWLKPASPLQDGLEDLYAEPRRATWMTVTIQRHIWDRGGSGRRTLRWALARRIPYLTVGKKSANWRRFRRRPRTHTRRRVPVFVRPDRTMAGGRPKGTTPQEVIFPAHPRKGRASRRALRYRVGAPLSKAELRQVDRVYKTRWPNNENPIKALVGVGFDRNLDRGLTPTTSRGTDGELARLDEREHALLEEMKDFVPTTAAKSLKAFDRFVGQKATIDEKRAAIHSAPLDKGARMPTGAEGLCKNLMLLMYNVLAMLLWKSPLREVQHMTPLRVHELLLGRGLLACREGPWLTLWIDPVPDSSERALQEELLRLFNEQPLSLGGRRLDLRLLDPPGKKWLLRVLN